VDAFRRVQSEWKFSQLAFQQQGSVTEFERAHALFRKTFWSD
jgi:hypothetical protein